VPKTLKELFITELNDMLDAETRLTKALPKLAKAAYSEELTTAFTDHLKQTQGHLERLKQVMESMGETPKRRTCKAMVGLLEEAQELMDEDGPPSVKDAGLIAAAQKVEHYEMATYGCLRTWAELLGEADAAKTLQGTLEEEGKADKLLTQVAEGLVLDTDDDDEDEEPEKVQAGRSGTMTGAAPRASHSRKKS
jgi:ferritin-like metal-binding protein YciE